MLRLLTEFNTVMVHHRKDLPMLKDDRANYIPKIVRFRNIQVIADNVGDITRMGSDLFGSYVEASFATLVVASIFSYGFNHQFTVMMYPLLISSMGNYFFVLPFGQWVTSVIGFVIEYSTRNAYSPVLDVDSCIIGTATNIILGLALGYKSVIILIFTIADVVGKSHLIRERTDTLDATGITTDLLIWFLWHSLVPL
ncbi:hypothetical protein IFM89_026135 [Coptis chinensis]|uniref:H(+)-exporting diphosphatase n=1 Tax=Coptis chinensis TaxID=261450 RepID=A0A835ICZ2_9MAGN|nr:hypothetical protein IFM89_026135 [Coptis chinensis]